MILSVRIQFWGDDDYVVLRYRWRKKDGKFVLLNKKVPVEGIPKVAANFAALMRDIYDVPNLKDCYVL